MLAIRRLRPSVVLSTLCAGVCLSGLGPVGCAPAAKQEAATTKPAAKADHDHEHDHDHADEKKAAKPAAKGGDDHDDHKHPETLAEGVKELEQLVGSVKEHLAADAKEKADDAVHLVGHLLEDVEKLVPAAKLSAEAEAGVKKAVEELYDCFDKLDVALHAEAGKADAPAAVHKQLAERIEAAIKQLKDAKPAADKKD
jgi:hypothetical protein